MVNQSPATMYPNGPEPQPANNPHPLEHPSAAETKQALKEVIGESEEVIVSISGVPVLDLFPDSLAIDRAKLTITKRAFFRMAEIISIRIEDVLNITSSVGPFFASVTVVARIMGADQITTVNKLWRDDASRFKRIGQGYIIARQQGIDCTNLPLDELRKLLDKLGQDEHQG